MTAIDRPVSTFRVSDLWTNQRSRAILIQVIALALLFAFFFWIVSNTVENLARLGVETGYGFLWDPAGYDINQTLIKYDSRSPHIDAAIVGLLNTALVAAAGIIFATFLGFTAGVLRLSNNWVVSKLMTVYIEFIRNVPVLLQMLLWYGIVIHTTPSPRNALEPMSGFFLSNRGFIIPKPVFLDGSWLILAGLIAGVGFAIWFSRFAKRALDETGKIYPVFTVGLAAVLGLPVLGYLIGGMPVDWVIPALSGFNFKGGLTITPEFFALWFSLSVYTGAFIAEIVRAGIMSVSHGQTEASFALGMRPGRTMRQVILPQALRVIIPPLISQYLNLTKNSSLAIAIGYMDIVATIGGISLNQTGRALESMSIVLSIYLLFSLGISALMNAYNRRIALVER